MENRELRKVLSQLVGETSVVPSLQLPEHELLATILATGACEAAGYNLKDSRISNRKRRVRQMEAQAWINSDLIFMDEEKGVSFGFICEACSFDPDSIRTALRNGKITGAFATHFRNRERKGLKKKKFNEEIH